MYLQFKDDRCCQISKTFRIHCKRNVTKERRLESVQARNIRLSTSWRRRMSFFLSCAFWTMSRPFGSAEDRRNPLLLEALAISVWFSDLTHSVTAETQCFVHSSGLYHIFSCLCRRYECLHRVLKAAYPEIVSEVTRM